MRAKIPHHAATHFIFSMISSLVLGAWQKAIAPEACIIKGSECGQAVTRSIAPRLYYRADELPNWQKITATILFEIGNPCPITFGRLKVLAQLI